MRTYTKDDVTVNYGAAAVNIKVPWEPMHRTIAELQAQGEIPTTLTEEWIRANVSEDTLDHLFWDACQFEYEYFEGWAAEIMPGTSFHVEGRSGGWAVSNYDRDDIDGWDAVQLAKWRKIERIGHEIAAGVPAQVILLVAINYYDADNVFVDAAPVGETLAGV